MNQCYLVLIMPYASGSTYCKTLIPRRVFPSCFSSFPLVFRGDKALPFWLWACCGLELMGLGISTNSIYSHLNVSLFVAFQAATCAGGGWQCYSCQQTKPLICFASGLWLLLFHKHICVLWDSTKHISFLSPSLNYLFVSISRPGGL